jgi:hypothetical protein
MDLYSKHGIKRQFFIVGTPQHNGVVEIKNGIVQEMFRTMLMDSKLTDVFLDTCSAYNNSHSKQRNDLKK